MNFNEPKKMKGEKKPTRDITKSACGSEILYIVEKEGEKNKWTQALAHVYDSIDNSTSNVEIISNALEN